MSPKKTLVQLDFHEHDTEAACQFIQGLVQDGRVSGMVFAVMLKKGEKPIFGATGRLATNDIEAAGLSAILEDQFTQPYLLCSSGR